MPKIPKEVERFLGFANYHRSFIKDFAKIAASLKRNTSKNPFEWKEGHQQASSPVLA